MYGKDIKSARIITGETQNQVAKATGLPQNTLSWIELDKGVPNIQQCVMLADYYGISLDELIGRECNFGDGIVKEKKSDVLPLDETELLKNYRKLSYKGKARVAAYADLLREQEEGASSDTQKKA